MNLREFRWSRGLVLALLAASTALSACQRANRPESFSGGEPVRFENGTGTGVSAWFFRGAGQHPPGILLVHGAGESRHVWGDFGARLQARGYSCLLLDLGGHGESATDAYDFRTFKDGDWANRVNDATAGVQALIDSGADPRNIGFIGAGFGSTLGLAAAQVGGIQTAILLSPALESHGLKAEPLIAELATVPILILASEGDSLAALSGQHLRELAPGFCEYRAYPGNLHGADLIAGSESAAVQIEQWLEQTLSVAGSD